MDEPAFPSLHYKAVELGEEGRDYASFEGMTLRDYFAAKAMQGALSSGNCKSLVELSESRTSNNLAMHCYKLADAMLKERENHLKQN